MTRFLTAAASALLVLICSAAHADEGMWTFHGFPFDKANSALKTRLDQAWLDRVRTSTVRLSNCTGSFISGSGLILTNHHCVEACLAELSSKEKSLVEEGFLAARPADEKKCQTQIADVLVNMDDVTAKISAAIAGKDEKAANEARKATLTQLESECEEASKGARKCQAVTLYEGGQYWMYQYQRYTDVRIVFAPEADIAAFGGDPDNFQFPRWCLDMGILRIYDAKGAPVKTPNHLKVNFAGPSVGEPVFVSGHPGSTDRLLTVAELEAQRNYELPNWLLRYSELRGRYIQFASENPTNARITADQLNGIENSIKVRRKQLDALHEDALFARKQAEEDNLKKQVAANASLRASIGDPWGDIARANAAKEGLYLPVTFIENGAGFQGRLMGYARNLVRGAEERTKPNSERFREFTDAALKRIEQQLGASVPNYPELETLRMTFGLERMREWLGPDHPLVRQLLAKESPAEVAKRVIGGTKLGDPAVRMALWNGGAAAIAASDDPMIQLARTMEPEARKLRKQYEDLVEAPMELASEKIARARFAVLGTSVYPDATFTLRLNWGTVGAWVENGAPVNPFTRLSRLFERATGAEPFRIPDSWLKVKDKLDMNTPFNLATNNDIVGGNSGSPLINAKGELVGLLFDGNIHSISGSYWFDTEKNRSVAVHPAIIKEALSKVYGATGLLTELSK
ncbi:MAG TPA: S46 family peptidase [Steroidobacteraceae bacterium]|nr:S46 family peptidase [Steroidobacteraceae bacterium]